MTMSKNEGIEKDNNDKDKQYQKREDMIFSFFRKLRKIELWTYIAYVIVLTICFQSGMVMLLTLLVVWYFRKLWRICDLISVNYLMENYQCYLWIEIFEKLRIWCCVWPNFYWTNVRTLLVTFWLKSKLKFCEEVIHVSCKVNIYFFSVI